MGRLAYLHDVVTLKLNEQKCIGCGMCLTVCPHAVFELTNGTVEIKDRDSCMECGACAQNCPVEAISVRSGVGCATAVLNSLLGRENGSCCCTLDEKETPGEPPSCSPGENRSRCC
jgi:NAD-dependent dihydropyrimidine dehydrogenase PreA subunit